MSKKSADKAFRAIVKRLASVRSILTITHARPDGDALGSMLAITLAARAAGKTAYMLLLDSIPPRYEFLFPDERPAAARQFAALASEVEVVLVVDTCAFAQLDGLAQALRDLRERVIVVDHHATHDDVGTVRWIDTTAAAVGVMIGELLDALDWPVEFAAAEALLTAVTSDTGWFRFANTDARALRAVARWLELGVRVDKIYAKLYQSDRPERLKLLQRILSSLELHCDGQLAVMTVRKADFDQTGARPDETENLINEALRLKSVEAVALITENADCVRVSLRSREKIDVAAVAKRFGGGGHQRAAGLRSTENLEHVRERLIGAVEEALAKAK